MKRAVPPLGRSWFALVVLGSAIVLVVTLAAYAFEGPRAVTRALHWVGAGGENNVGAWWSGMLLLVAAVLAFDGSAAASSPPERRGWGALAALLLILSFDEVASLHEYLANSGLHRIAVFGTCLAALGAYALAALYRSGVPARRVAAIFAVFAMLATVPLQEYVQQTREWNDGLAYGLRAFLEEGTEIAAMLILVGVLRRNTAALMKGTTPDALVAVGRYRAPLLLAAGAAIPVLVAATFVLPYPGGPADWLASSLYLACALLVARQLALAPAAASGSSLVLLVGYVAASAGSTAIPLHWDPEALGARVGLRGLFVTLLLLAAPLVLGRNGRDARPLALGIVALLAFVAAWWPASQVLWCTVPPAVALWIYGIESAASASQPARMRSAAAAPVGSGGA